jgi:hypothetical protein
MKGQCSLRYDLADPPQLLARFLALAFQGRLTALQGLHDADEFLKHRRPSRAAS